MKVGISTACLYPMETLDALEKLLQLGVDKFEIFFNTFSEIKKEYCSKLVRLLKEYNANVKSIHPFTSGYEPYLIFSNYEKRTNETLEFYRNFFYCAATIGAEIVVLHGDKKTCKNGISDELYFERFARLAKIGREYGVVLAQENVNAFRSQNPDFIRKMKNYLGSVASFVFDIKQAVRSHNNPYDMCEAMGENLIHVHINDNDDAHDCLLPGCGDMDYQRIFEILNNSNYKGDLVIEVYRSNFCEIDELIVSYNYLSRKVERNFC